MAAGGEGIPRETNRARKELKVGLPGEWLSLDQTIQANRDQSQRCPMDPWAPAGSPEQAPEAGGCLLQEVRPEKEKAQGLEWADW